MDTHRRNLKSSERSTIFLIFLFLLVVTIQFVIVYNQIQIGGLSWETYFIEYGDSFSSILTSFTLVIILIQSIDQDREHLSSLQSAELDRKIQIEEAKLSRKIMRIRERLDFYSDIYDDFTDIQSIEDPVPSNKIARVRSEINRVFEENLVKRRYPRFVIENDLIEFTTYFAEYYKYLTRDQLSDTSIEQTQMNLDSLVDHILFKYQDLVKEYQVLIDS